MTDLPQDPTLMSYTWSAKTNNIGCDNKKWNNQGFLYFVVNKNGATSGAVVLATRVETDSKANYVSQRPNFIELSGDYKDIFTCTSVEKVKDGGVITTYWETANTWCQIPSTWTEHLRYILKF